MLDDDVSSPVPADVEAALAQLHPVAVALARRGGRLPRRVPPAPRGHNGHWLKGHSGNPTGRARVRFQMRPFFHDLGMSGLKMLSNMLADPTLPPRVRADILLEVVKASHSIRQIRSDASAAKKAEDARRHDELVRATDALAEQARRALDEQAARADLRDLVAILPNWCR